MSVFDPIDLAAAHTISRSHRHEQRRLHAMPEGYGGKGMRHRETVRLLLKETDSASALDYGCGQGTLWGARFSGPNDPNWQLQNYDPAVDKFSDPPRRADLVVCTDVMEHVERARVAIVIDHLWLLTQKALFVVVALTDTSKRLSDGRSAHVVLERAEWWADAFGRQFTPYAWPEFARPISIPAGPPKHWAAVLAPRRP